MLQAHSNPYAEATKLTVAVEKVLRSIARLLIGRISLSRLQELVRNAYLAEAESKLKREEPTRRVTLSRMAILTGIDSRTITKYLNSRDSASSIGRKQDLLAIMTPETSVIARWMDDSAYRDSKSGKPRALALEEGVNSFSSLVSRAIGSRGITAMSMLDQLESSGAVDFDSRTQRVRLKSTGYYPFMEKNEVGMLDVGFSTMAALACTVEQNMVFAKTAETPHFQRSVISHELSSEDAEMIRRQMRTSLEKAENNARKMLLKLEGRTTKPGNITAGISLFYFEEAN